MELGWGGTCNSKKKKKTAGGKKKTLGGLLSRLYLGKKTGGSIKLLKMVGVYNSGICFTKIGRGVN